MQERLVFGLLPLEGNALVSAKTSKREDKDKEEFWNRLFLSLSEEEKETVRLAPILLKCSFEDAELVGSLVWCHLFSNPEAVGSGRYTAQVIAEILNKRFGRKWAYMDFYLSNLRFYDPMKKNSYEEERKRMEKKYASKVCINC